MDPLEYQTIFQTELHHWWYRGMASITLSILQRWYSHDSGLRILDAGCGTGAAMTTFLADYGSVIGFDISSLALSYCQLRAADQLLQASVIQLPFPAQTFDLVTSFDILYHAAVPDDASALAEMTRVLVPGGRLVLRLPAYDWLRGNHDRIIHTARRYTARQVKYLLQNSGLVVELASYANTFLFPVALLKRLLENISPKKQGRSDLLIKTDPVNDLLASILGLEAPVVSTIGLPYGLSVFAVGIKPQ